jgi:hypothetical protein
MHRFPQEPISAFLSALHIDPWISELKPYKIYKEIVEGVVLKAVIFFFWLSR